MQNISLVEKRNIFKTKDLFTVIKVTVSTIFCSGPNFHLFKLFQPVWFFFYFLCIVVLLIKVYFAPPYQQSLHFAFSCTRQETRDKTIFCLGSYTTGYINCFPNNLKYYYNLSYIYYIIHNKLLQIAMV